MDDLGRELDSLTSAATRGVVVPPPDEVRRRARHARRQGIGAGLGSLAVVAIAVAALWPRGDAPAPSSPVAQPSTPPATSMFPRTQPTPVPSSPPTETTPARATVAESALLTTDDVGDTWTIESPPPKVSEVRFDPCGDGKLGPKPEDQLVQRFQSDSGEIVEHVAAYDDALAAFEALRKALDRCGSAAGKVTYVERGALSAGDNSLVLKVQGGAQDPITTYVTIVRQGSLLMTLQDTRVGEPYTEKAHRAFAEKAAARLLS